MTEIACSLFADVRSLLHNKDVVMISMTSDSMSLAALWDVIVAQLTAAASDRQRLAAVLASSAVALNEEFVYPDDFASTTVRTTDFIAIIPPVSGG
jgi:sulfur carrier protein ThiS